MSLSVEFLCLPSFLSLARIVLLCWVKLFYSAAETVLLLLYRNCWARYDVSLQIAGPAGCGKTQFCLIMCVAAAMLHSQDTDCVNGATIYIDTESAFSPYR